VKSRIPHRVRRPVPQISALVAALLAASAPAVAQSTVVVAGPATGRHADTLPAMATGVRGARLAAAAGQVAPLGVTEIDDGCEAARAEGAARLIAAMKPDVVVGHPCPAAAIAAARIYAEAGVLFIALGVRHPELTAKRAGPSIFRLAGRDDRQGHSAAAALAAAAPGGRIAIVQDRTAYARDLTAAVATELGARQLPAPLVVPIVAGRKDYDTEIARLRLAPPEAVFFAGYPAEAAVVLRGLRKAGLDATVIASDANATDEFAAAAEASPGAAVKVMTRPPEAGGLDRDALSVTAGAAIELWSEALARAGTRDAAKVAAELTAAASPTTALGRIGFWASGDAQVPSFTAAPLVAGRWSHRAEAGP